MLRAVKGNIQTLKEVNNTGNGIAGILLNEVPDAFPPQLRGKVQPLTDKIPHEQDAKGTKKIAQPYQSAVGKLRLFKTPTAAPKYNLDYITASFTFVTSVVFLSWPKTTIENILALYYLYKTSKPDYVPKLSQLSKWVLPEEKSDNALGEPVKWVHQGFEAFQLMASSVEQVAFLSTIGKLYPLYLQTQEDGHPLERGYAINAIDFAWYCSVTLFFLNSIVLLYFIQKTYSPDLKENLRKCLTNGLTSLSDKIKQYLQSDPWDPATYENRRESYTFVRELVFEENVGEEKKYELKDPYTDVAYQFYNDAKSSILPWVARPFAKLSLKVVMWIIGSQMLPMKDYLIDISRNPFYTSQQLTYGLLPWIYHQTNLSTMLRNTLGAQSDLTESSESFVLDAQLTGPMLRQAEILLYMWLMYPVLIGFFHAVLERISDLKLVNPEKAAFKENLAQNTASCLKAYYFNIDEVPAEKKSEKDDDSWEGLYREARSLAVSISASEILPSVGNGLTKMTDMARPLYGTVVEESLNAVSYDVSSYFMSYVDGSSFSLIKKSLSYCLRLKERLQLVPQDLLARVGSPQGWREEVANAAVARINLFGALYRSRAGAPVVDAGAPVVNAGAPVVNAAAPVVNAAAPVVNAAAPVVNAEVEEADRRVVERSKAAFIAALENYIRIRSQDRWIEVTRFIMPKQRKIAAAQSVINFLTDGGSAHLTDAVAFSEGELGRIVKERSAFDWRTAVEDKIAEVNSTCCLLKCFR